jgi:pyrimidine operon attenuation protein/uracil phosphoribosyltransferase
MSEPVKEEELVAPAAVADGLERIAKEIAERDPDGGDVALVAIRQGGEAVAQRLGQMIGRRTGKVVRLGSVDITLYRDDAATALPSPRVGPSHIPFDIQGARVVLVDDVIYTGRTIRAALDALLDYGRPRRIELAVVADRGGRELPVQPDYVVATTDVPTGSRVEVLPVGDDLRVVRTDGRRSRPPSSDDQQEAT